MRKKHPSSFLFIAVLILSICFTGCEEEIEPKLLSYERIRIAEKDRVLSKSQEYLNTVPITVTDTTSERSAGGKNDFYSEGDYWWPNPENPDGPYIRKDGMTNPDNFVSHRRAMVRLSQIAGNLASAYLITRDPKFLEAIQPHISAWFVDDATKMNPHLLYAQAIKGKVTGRGIGIIDTIHLMEVVKAIEIMEMANAIDTAILNKTKQWFREYVTWLSTHPYSEDEKNKKNNHGVCWVMQMAVFAKFVGNNEVVDECIRMYKNNLLPEQMDINGSFPKELNRTKPYGYSLFVLDAMATVCQVLSTPEENLFNYTTEDGRNMQLGLDFIYLYMHDKRYWPFEHDVLYWEDWPVKHPLLVFGGFGLKKPEYIKLWETLPTSDKAEVLRNLPVRHPLIWLKQKEM